jgi:hypothetical protein
MLHYFAGRIGTQRTRKLRLMNSNRKKLEWQLSPATTVDYAKIDSSQPDTNDILGSASCTSASRQGQKTCLNTSGAVQVFDLWWAEK